MDIYQQEYIKKQKEQAKLMDYMAWLSGSYIINAVQTALMPKKARYPQSPRSQEFPELSGEERFKEWVQEFNAQHDELPEYSDF